MLNCNKECVLDFLSSIADKHGDSDKQKREHRFLIYIGIAMSIGGLIWGSIALANGLQEQAFIPYSYTVFTIINFMYLYISKNFKIAQTIQVVISLFIPFIFQFALGGFIASGAVILWSVLTILVSFTFQKRDLALKWFYVYIILIVSSGMFDNYFRQFAANVPTDISILFFTLNITMVSIIIFVLFLYFIDSKEKLEDELALLADTDILTNIPNRRHFFKFATKELSRSKRNQKPFSLFMLDIDFFKSFNDEYGHDIGDDVLVAFSKFLKKSIRDVDLLCRYGGEEFMILMPETKKDEATICAQRIVDNCRKINIDSKENIAKITVSIGMTESNSSDDTMEKIIKRSDIALYKAKNNGRDQFQFI